MSRHERYSKHNGLSDVSTARITFTDGSEKSCQVRFTKHKILWVRLKGKCVFPSKYESQGIQEIRLNFIPYP